MAGGTSPFLRRRLVRRVRTGASKGQRGQLGAQSALNAPTDKRSEIGPGAPVQSAPVCTTTREGSLGLLNKDGMIRAVLVGVLVTVSGAAVIALAHYFGLTPRAFVEWLKTVGRFLVADVTLPRWWFWLWAAISVTTVVLVALRIRSKLASPAWLRYRSDIIFGLRWRWNLSENGAVHSPQMYCPEPACDHQLSDAVFNYARPNANGTVWDVRCDRCGHAMTVPFAPDLRRRVQSEVQRRLRTGEWENAQ